MFLSISAAMAAYFCASAQIIDTEAVTTAKDSTAVASETVTAIVDSSLVDMDIFEIMPSRYKGDRGSVMVWQSGKVRRALREKVGNSGFKAVPGYRVRIYFSNAQNAREKSAAEAAKFHEKFGTYSVYHNFVNPNFKVTVGDFRTKSEALELLDLVKKDFPSAFIVKENIILAD